MHSKRFLISVFAITVLAACQTVPSNAPLIRVVVPQNNATVKGPKVTIQTEVLNWTLGDANRLPAAGEGHLHFVIDAPNDIRAGMLVPLDNAAKYVHAGKAPYTTRDIDLPPGNHTITVVMGGNDHIALASPAPVSVTFLVQ